MEGRHTADEIAAILRAQKWRCACCRTNLKRVGKHKDHIKPLSKGGSNSASNIQFLCPSCNCKKHDRDPIEHARLIGLLI